MKPNVSFFCPAYLDEANLPVLVPRIVEYLENATADYEIVIIEDGSPDRTGEVADVLAAEYEKVRVVHHPKNLGYGGALRTGFATATKFEYVFYTDGDGQFDIRELGKLLEAAAQADVVIGYRRNRADTIGRKVQSKTFNFIGQRFFRANVRDINTAFKLFKRPVIDSMTITSASVAINLEMIAKARQNGFIIAEVPVTHYPRIAGKASGGKPSVIIGTIGELRRCHREIFKSGQARRDVTL